jgi:hypothetical protein
MALEAARNFITEHVVEDRLARTVAECHGIRLNPRKLGRRRVADAARLKGKMLTERCAGDGVP